MKLKRIYALVLTLVLTLTCAFAFASCSDEETVITVTFYSDGEVYATVDLENGIVALPKAPEKTGFDFIGWYYDNETFAQPFSNAALEKEPPRTLSFTLSGRLSPKDIFTKPFITLRYPSPVPKTA